MLAVRAGVASGGDGAAASGHSEDAGDGTSQGHGRRALGRRMKGQPAEADSSGPRVRMGKVGSGSGRGSYAKFDAKAPAIMGVLMTKYGLTKDQAAGVVGNLGHESARFTAYHENGKVSASGGVGWAQWTGPRRRAFERWTAARGLNPTSDEASWRFLTEGDPETAAAIAAVKRTHPSHVAVRAFHDSFEKSADISHGRIVKPKNWNSRLDLADRADRANPVAGIATPPVPRCRQWSRSVQKARKSGGRRRRLPGPQSRLPA
jgi:hypothetical protein